MTHDSNADIPVSPDAYLEKFLEIVQRNSIRSIDLRYPDLTKPAMDWDAYCREVREEFELLVPQTIDELVPILDSATHKLEDGHSFWVGYPNARAGRGKSVSERKPEPLAVGKMLYGTTGYLSLPRETPGNDEEASMLSRHLRDELVRLDRHDLKGWVIDLRSHNGGGMFGGLSALWPLIQDYGVTGHFLPPDRDSWESQLIRQHDVLGHEHYALRNTRTPIAVLQGNETRSAGEAIAVAFRGLPHVRSFGTPSAGMTTGNAGFDFPDGQTLALATCVYADRTGRVYGGKLQPDYFIENTPKPVKIDDDYYGFPDDYDMASDPVVRMAAQWAQQNKRSSTPERKLKSG